jgi:tetratricopeptide (TPR) repeat protein
VKIHPSDLLLEEMLLSVQEERRALLRHLSGCRQCRSRLSGLALRPSLRRSEPGSFLGPARDLPTGSHSLRNAQPASAVDYGTVIDRSERKYLDRARALQHERGEAPALLAELLAVQPEKRKLLLANSPRFQTWGVYELLLERSWALRGARRDSEELAWLAIELSAHLDSAYYTHELIADLCSRAWSYLANLRRLTMDFVGAEQAFGCAYLHLKKGTHEALERAVFLDLKASLRCDQRRFPEAIRLLRRCVAIFLRQGDEHRAGKSLVNLAAVLLTAGEPEAAVSTTQDSLPLIDPDQDERVFLCAWSVLINAHIDMGRFIEARGLYRKARSLYQKFDDAYWGGRRLWAKAKIERGLGQSEPAEALYLEARDRFVADGLPYEAGLVSLDLALLYVHQERNAELKQLAIETLPIFTSLQIHREAMAAFLFLKQAVEAERVSIEVVTGIAEFLKRASADPGLKFEAPA